MSSQKRAKKEPQARKPKESALERCASTQERLTRAEETARKAADARRQAVREAFASGVPSQDIAATVKVSRAKIYQLLGGVKRPTA